MEDHERTFYDYCMSCDAVSRHKLFIDYAPVDSITNLLRGIILKDTRIYYVVVCDQCGICVAAANLLDLNVRLMGVTQTKKGEVFKPIIVDLTDKLIVPMSLNTEFEVEETDIIILNIPNKHDQFQTHTEAEYVGKPMSMSTFDHLIGTSNEQVTIQFSKYDILYFKTVTLNT